MNKRAVIGGIFAVSTLFALQGGALTFAESSTDFSITTNAVLQLDIPNSTSLLLTPTSSAGDFKSTTITATVSTNNMLGYTLIVSPSNAAETTDLIGSNTNMPTLASSDEGYTESAFTANKWGYRLNDSSNYFGMPSTLSPEAWDTFGPTNETEHNLTLAAKVDGSFPAGSYTTTLNFELVAKRSELDWEDIAPDCATHPEKCDPVTGKVAIQSIDEETCNAVEVFDSQFQVTDLRDHKNYWISKLRDGNCWMTQNLDLDLSTSTTLTSASTDLGWNGSSYDTASWTPNKTTYHYEDETGDILDSSSAAAYSFDPGDYYQQGTYFAAQVCNYLTDETSTCISDAIDPTNGTHGHVGNYYTWAAAVAIDNPYSINSGKVESSICPKNWRLPLADATASDFANINNLYNSANNSDQGFFEPPVYFIRGGYNSSGTSISAPGALSYYWSGVSSNNGVAYLYIYSGGGSPNTASTNFGKSAGIFARCVGRKTEYVNISFDVNGGSGSMSTQQIVRGGSAHLSPNTFTRENYYFNGWNTKADGSGEGYGDKSVYSPAKNETSNTLYAQWTTTAPICTEDCGGSNPKYESGITIQRAYELAYTEHHLGMYEEQHEGQGDYARVDSWGTPKEEYKGYDVRFAMQDIYLTYNNTKVCDLVTVIGDQYQALDVRDNKLYYIGKMKDGTCWMTQNLDLNLVHVANDNDALYTHDNTDIGWGTDTSVNKWNPSVSTIPVTDITSSGNISEWCVKLSYSENKPCSVDTGDWYWTDTWYEFKNTSYNYLTGNQGDKFFQTPTGSGEHGHVGNYYSWTIAIASNDSSNYSSNTYTDPSANPQNSICPAGWRLPIITSYEEGQLGTNDFYNLAYEYGNTLDTDQYYSSSPLWFVRGGLINMYSLGSAGEWGWYLSSTVSGSSSNRALDTVSNYVNVTGSNHRSEGYSVRCLAR